MPPMETDLFGEEMSSVTQRADRAQHREIEREETKAHQKLTLPSTHAGNGKEKSDPVFVLPRRGQLLSQFLCESGQMCGRCHMPLVIAKKFKAEL